MESGFGYLGGRRWLEEKMRHGLADLGRMIFPHFCLACGTEGKLLCRVCENQYALSRGILFSVKLSKTVTMRCFSAGYYADPALRNLLHLYKYEQVREAGQILTRIFVMSAARHFSAILVAVDDPLVTYVPMNSIHEAQRGFNQVKLLARELANDFELEVGDAMVQRRFSLRRQVQLTVTEQRLKNVRGVFVVNDEAVRGRDILLVDDVFTTGATISECARTLIIAGARSVTAVVALKGSCSPPLQNLERELGNIKQVNPPEAP